MEKSMFESMYEGRPPWDIGRPQAEVVRLEEAGAIPGSVLDVGCGTGDNALYLASRGHETLGLDFAPNAIDRARAKAAGRGLPVEFRVADALDLAGLGRRFDSVIDSGLFHTFDDAERPRFVSGLAAVVRPGGVLHILCFSEHEPGDQGPRRVTQQEIRDAFAQGWRVESIEPVQFEVVETPDGPQFTPGGPRGWRATVVRDGA